MSRLSLALAALALLAPALPAASQVIGDPADLADRSAEGYLFLDAPNTFPAPQSKMRLVFDTQGRAAALTPNQYWAYSKLYKAALARLSLRMSVSRAEPHARDAALRAIAASGPNFVVEDFKLEEFLSYEALLPVL